MSKKFTVLVGLLMAVAITGYSVSGTYAKYTDDFAATSTAKIAKWDFTVNGKSSAEGELTFDLFKTAENDSLIEDEENGVKIIAPGSTGTATILLKNNSDVKASLAIKFSADESSPLRYTITVGDTPVAEDISNLDKIDWSKLQNNELIMNDNSSELKITIKWEWPYEYGKLSSTKENSNIRDTALGIASAKSYNSESNTRTSLTFTATITATQAAA